MVWISDLIEPGTYQHYKGSIYVVIEIVTHADNPEGKMDPLPQDKILVIYRDLETKNGFFNGRNQALYNRYARTLEDFKALVEHNGKTVKRFTKI